jgi:hypothetical protein
VCSFEWERKVGVTKIRLLSSLCTGIPHLPRRAGGPPGGLVPLHQRHPVQPTRVHMRLVVQRELCRRACALQVAQLFFFTISLLSSSSFLFSFFPSSSSSSHSVLFLFQSTPIPFIAPFSSILLPFFCLRLIYLSSYCPLLFILIPLLFSLLLPLLFLLFHISFLLLLLYYSLLSSLSPLLLLVKSGVVLVLN